MRVARGCLVLWLAGCPGAAPGGPPHDRPAHRHSSAPPRPAVRLRAAPQTAAASDARPQPSPEPPRSPFDPVPLEGPYASPRAYCERNRLDAAGHCAFWTAAPDGWWGAVTDPAGGIGRGGGCAYGTTSSSADVPAPYLGVQVFSAETQPPSRDRLALRLGDGTYVSAGFDECGANTEVTVRSIEPHPVAGGRAEWIVRLETLDAPADGDLYALDRYRCTADLLVCGLGPSGRPHCTPPVRIGWAERCQGHDPETGRRAATHWNYSVTPQVRADGGIALTRRHLDATARDALGEAIAAIPPILRPAFP
jgi:hypothetical protein